MANNRNDSSSKKSDKAPRRNPYVASNIQTILRYGYREIIQPKREKFNKYLNDAAVKEWVQQETTVRKQKYYPVKHILAISPIGLSFSDIFSGGSDSK